MSWMIEKKAESEIQQMENWQKNWNAAAGVAWAEVQRQRYAVTHFESGVCQIDWDPLTNALSAVSLRW